MICIIIYTGFRKGHPYGEIVNYIQTEQPLLKYPDTRVTLLLNTPQYSSLLHQYGFNEQAEYI